MNLQIEKLRQESIATWVRPAKGYACKRIFDNSQLVELFEKWLLVLGYAEPTRQSYIFTAKQFGKFLERPLTHATKEDVRNYISLLFARNLAPGTLSHRHFALRTLFSFLRLGDQVRTSPPHLVPTRKLPKRLPRAKSEDEINRVISAAGTPRDRAILELLYATGLRVSEAAHLNAEEIHFDKGGGSFTVRGGKGNKDRIGFFGRNAAHALKKYLGNRHAGSVFGIGPRGIYRVVRKAAARAGVSAVTPHTFRHSFATHLLNHGADIRFVQELLGHTSLVATQKYLHVALVGLQQSHEQFHPRG